MDDTPLPENWVAELARVRYQVLEHVRALPVGPVWRWKREASKNMARLKVAHWLLRELRETATDDQRRRIDEELERP